MNCRYVVCLVFVTFHQFHLITAKTVSGVFSTLVAKTEIGQYISSFCFHGNAVVNFKINTTGHVAPTLYMYISDDWYDAAEDTDCKRRLGKARLWHELMTKEGNITVAHSVRPRIWHIVYADSYTCDPSRPIVPIEQPNFIQFEIQLLNPDSLGNPTEHFGDEETEENAYKSPKEDVYSIDLKPLQLYFMTVAKLFIPVVIFGSICLIWYEICLLRFHQLLTLAYFVLACMFAPRLWQTLSKGGPMHLVIQLLTVSVCLQTVGSFLMCLHLSKYHYDGTGSPFKELLSEFFDVLSQFAMLYMLLSLSLGWTLASTHCRYSHLKAISEKPAAKVVAVLAVLQGSLFLWEQYNDSYIRTYHAHRSWAGTALVVLRILLAGLFGWNLYITIKAERSSLKREFYSAFTKACMLWFLCYPAIVAATWIFPEYLRAKLVIMGVLLCQSVAGAWLYKLFLSRSLYWEVSALSSTLPLRFDKTFSLKMYS